MLDAIENLAQGIRAGHIHAFVAMGIHDTKPGYEFFGVLMRPSDIEKEQAKFAGRVIKLLGLIEVGKKWLLRYVETGNDLKHRAPTVVEE